MGAGLVLVTGLVLASEGNEVQCRANRTNCDDVHVEVRWTCASGLSCCTKAIKKTRPDGTECIDEVRTYCCIPREGE